VNACNPLLQAHPPWAQDNTSHGSPFPPLCSISRRPIWAGTRSDNLLVGPRTPGVKTPTPCMPTLHLGGKETARWGCSAAQPPHAPPSLMLSTVYGSFASSSSGLRVTLQQWPMAPSFRRLFPNCSRSAHDVRYSLSMPSHMIRGKILRPYPRTNACRPRAYKYSGTMTLASHQSIDRLLCCPHRVTIAERGDGLPPLNAHHTIAWGRAHGQGGSPEGVGGVWVGRGAQEASMAP
jgi:hypothetical protein